MSSFFTSIVKNVKEFYSEINAATLTGAIDVIVVEQEDGTFKSSPFHVRFGKLGVLKAKEKIVDLEINGNPVLLQMKLDDTGAAFFVEDVASSDEIWNEELATSPFPDQNAGPHVDWKERKAGVLKPTKLFAGDETAIVPSKFEVEKCVQSEELRMENKKGSINKKKRKRRRKMKQSRRGGSRSSLQEFLLESGSLVESKDDLFDTDDVNDADQEDEIGGSEPECGASSVPKCLSGEFLKIVEQTRTTSIGNSLIGSRVPLIPKSPSEAEILDAICVVSEPVEMYKPSQGLQYFSDGERGTRGGRSTLDPSPFKLDRPSTPGFFSDSELDTHKSHEDQNVWKWGELPSTSPTPQPSTATMKMEKQSWFVGWSNKDRSKDDLGGVYLDDIVDNPDLQEIYLNPIKTEPVDPLDISEHAINTVELVGGNLGGIDESIDDDCESGNGFSLPMSPRSLPGVPSYDSDDTELNSHSTDLPSLISKHFPDLAASMCGGLDDHSITPHQFESHLLTYPQFLESLSPSGGASLTKDNKLVIRLHEKYLSWDKAAPILLSVMLFRQPLPWDVIRDIIKDGLDVNINIPAEDVIKKDVSGKKTSSWFGWFGGGRKIDEVKEENLEDGLPEIELTSRETSPEIEFTDIGEKTSHQDASRESIRFKKTLRLSSEKLAELNLKPGSNEVEFSVTTAFQGTSRCKCHIYLWHHTDKVVISDIDGTITKSDVLGHILPVIGRDWAQSGVAQLFTKINNNSYKIMYLSARAIGQASITKEYLQSVKQGDVCLPDGPIFLNPDSLIHAFRREVIDRNPEEFKIRCLKDIQSLFEGKNPFFAGYGNRPNDAYAYRAVGIPVSRIFTINPAGELRHELTQSYQTSYTEQDSMVDLVFPPVGKDGFDPEFRIQEFSSFGFWKEKFQEIDPALLEQFLPECHVKT